MSKKSFTIFFSWQSDIAGNTKIIRDSLNAECQKQKEKGIEVCVDEATRNLPGSPKIEDAVLDKICNADIFVCDITPVVANAGKQIPNSNVLFELGFAFHVLGEKRIIMLAKKGNWGEKDMPFDFNHRRIGKFSSQKDCDLSFEVDCCIQECIKHPKDKRFWNKVMKYIPWKGIKINNDSLKEEATLLTKATETSTVFFARRMSSAFHGIRGLVEIKHPRDIRQSLKILLQPPLRFEAGLDKANIDPVWWFRGGSAMNIKTFSFQASGKALMDFYELRIKRILVFRDSGTYYSQYVYVETVADKPTVLYKRPSDEVFNEIVDHRGYYDEEYADFKPNWFLPTKHISRQDDDDGATKIWGKHVELQHRAKPRCRYLTPYNFVICAKFSPYNCHEFSRTSDTMFRGMLDGNVTNDEFHRFMMKFPKRDY